ncbi:MAG: acyl-CoA--6-aminopenicillanic acid acyl-transferase [Kordia sp.]|nr:MAG: acyl-CoA--6-aminopenicillanic acid acyl-transferase [Kordia sp.]
MKGITYIKLFLYCCLLLIVSSCGTSKSLHHQPVLNGYNDIISERIVHSDSLITLDDNILKLSKYGHWQLLVKGDPLERGLITGSLTQELLQYQEKVFLDKVGDIVPSKFKQRLLRGFLKWFNRKLYLNVKEEYKTEIYGLTRYASEEFNYLALPYLRSLYLHGAHDIGHALQDLALVGCSSFAAWDAKTPDGKLVIGRNFDFYAGDDFAKNKIISFVKPATGIPFMTVTWGGMIGAVSGMNANGLTITLNAGKSDMPLVAKTPISLLAREIIQYASTIEEAIVIAKKSTVFVSEAIMIGSAKDNKAILIEVAPNNFGVYDVANANQLICSNHFQSEAYSDDENNSKHILESHSKYRFDKMMELFDKNNTITPKKVVEILREKRGLNNETIGYGNEKALNQLLAHHGVVFKPSERQVWVSASPYQLGAFVAYDLDDIFSNSFSVTSSFVKEELVIAEDPFIYSIDFENYEAYRVFDRRMDIVLKNKKQKVSQKELTNYIDLNPDLWIPHFKVGKYYYQEKQYVKALPYFEMALQKEITTVPDKEAVEKHLKKCINKID